MFVFGEKRGGYDKFLYSLHKLNSGSESISILTTMTKLVGGRSMSRAHRF